MNSLKKDEGVPHLNFERAPGVPCLTLCVPMTVIYVMPSAYHVLRGFCSVWQ